MLELFEVETTLRGIEFQSVGKEYRVIHKPDLQHYMGITLLWRLLEIML